MRPCDETGRLFAPTVAFELEKRDPAYFALRSIFIGVPTSTTPIA
jgi:hypothetical protein